MTPASSKTALLVIDVQQAMFGPEAVCYEPERLLANIGELTARARQAGVPVIYIQHCEREGPFTPKCAEWQIHPAIAPAEGEAVFEKWACSAFWNTKLDAELRAQSIERLVICGLQTEFCVDTACRVAQSLGYGVTLVKDAHSTFDSPGLKAEKIIEHHNWVLSGIIQGVTPIAQINF